MTDKTDRELMQQALEAIEDELGWDFGSRSIGAKTRDVLVSLRERLAQPEQEPVACIVKGCSNHRGEGRFIGALCSPCHTFITTGEGKYSQAYRNSQREWQGLTDQELHETEGYEEDRKLYRFARAVEAKLKEKNT